MKAIILAGGLGTRLRPIIGDDLPKCMAPIMGKPMISFVINRMKEQGITDITLSLGYKAEVFLEKYGHMKYKIEDEQLGTGGAIKNCIEGDEPEPVLVVNGDTICPVNYNDMLTNHVRSLTIAITDKGQSAGVYIINPDIFKKFPKKSFSFENDVIPKVAFSYYNIPWFSDFGTPEAYEKACRDGV